METILFLDTETSGKFLFDRPPSDPLQPRVCQVAAVLCDGEGDELSTFCTPIRPDGWTIPAEAMAVHGLSNEFCAAAGVPMVLALSLLDAMAVNASLVVAHNVTFDDSLLAVECDRAGRGPFAPSVKRHCTMQQGTPICRLPGGRGGYKWPRLEQLHRHLFGEAFEGAHGALDDTLACKRCFFEMRKRATKPAEVASV